MPKLELEIKEEKRVEVHACYASEADYCRSYSNPTKTVNIGTCEIKGRRPSQEDFLAVSLDEVRGFEMLPQHTQKLVLNETFKTMQAQYGQEGPGSTACLLIARQDEKNSHVTVANVGDSVAIVAILKNNPAHKLKCEVKSCHRINSLHHPNETEEKERIHATNKGFIEVNRLAGSLAVSRALGDNQYEEYGLSHEPDVFFFDAPTNRDEQIVLIVACDGLTDALTVEDIGLIAQQHYKKPPAELSRALVSSAYQKGSTDNISVGVMLGCSASMAIFDGHSGDQVARNVSMNIYPALKTEIQKGLKAGEVKQEKAEKKDQEKRNDPAPASAAPAAAPAAAIPSAPSHAAARASFFPAATPPVGVNIPTSQGSVNDPLLPGNKPPQSGGCAGMSCVLL